jgi:RNA polymerase sigma factor (TIGR02999 family)
MIPSSHEVTRLLRAWSSGDEAALARLAPLVEGELEMLAGAYLRRERPGHTLQTAALVNEAYLRLIDDAAIQWQNRAHFYGIAAQLMRRILVDHARRRQKLKRGGNPVRVSLTEVDKKIAEEPSADIVALDRALSTLSQFDARKSQIVELKFFGGMQEEAIAEVLKISLRTVQREWNLARAWLFNELAIS